jgi:hypothetical protein
MLSHYSAPSLCPVLSLSLSLSLSLFCRSSEWVSGMEIEGNETNFEVAGLSPGVLYLFRLTIAGGRSTGLRV